MYPVRKGFFFLSILWTVSLRACLLWCSEALYLNGIPFVLAGIIYWAARALFRKFLSMLVSCCPTVFFNLGLTLKPLVHSAVICDRVSDPGLVAVSYMVLSIFFDICRRGCLSFFLCLCLVSLPKLRWLSRLTSGSSIVSFAWVSVLVLVSWHFGDSGSVG